MKDPKSMALMVLEKSKKSGDASGTQSEGEASDSESMGSEGLHSAAEEIIDAVKSGDVAGLVDALKSFQEMCDDDSNEEMGDD